MSTCSIVRQNPAVLMMQPVPAPPAMTAYRPYSAHREAMSE